MDPVAQAVSWARAEQTGFWQQGDKVHSQARLDLKQIDHLVTTIDEHNDAWQLWFAAQRVEPLDLTYESLVSDPTGTVKRVLDFIGTVPPDDWTPESPHERQAGSINAEWARRYRATPY